MRHRGSTCVLAALLAATSLPAAAISCDGASLRAPGTPPEVLLSCVRQVATEAASADDVLLRAAFGALLDASFTRPAADEPELARRFIDELQRRGRLGPDDHRMLRAILMQNGLLDEVAADRAAHPAEGEGSMPARHPLASNAQPGAARYWVWETDGSLREQAVDLAHGMHLVIDASPGCHFCARAVAEIERDPALRRLFDGALWISRPEQGLSPAYWAGWNDAHPRERMVLVLDAQGWLLPPGWGTPQFRFFRNGREVASVLGWRPTGRDDLLRVAREQGFLPN